MRNIKKKHKKFEKSPVNTHKRRSKERAKEELLRAIRETNVGIDSLQIRDSENEGRRGRVSLKLRRDEIEARGLFSSSRSGFGFVSVEEYESDIFIPEDKTLGALDGDEVEIIYHVYKNRFGDEKTEGRVKKIIRYGKREVIGTVRTVRSYHRSRGRATESYILVPDDPKLPMNFEIENIGDAKEGDKLLCEIVRDSGFRRYAASVIKNFGDSYSKDANYEAILCECEIPVDFTPEELAEARFFSEIPLTDEGRVRRNEIIFTIDGEGAKDLDDAVSLRRVRGGWRLGVHIADVAAYVKERGHLDRAVMKRGTSVYFTDKVVPMLPEALSNGACSLNAGEDKYALSAIISLDDNGDIKGVSIEPSVIKSRVRGVYSEVNAIFDNRADKAVLAKYKAVIPTLFRMRELYFILREKACARGALDLETAEAEILLDGQGYPIDIVKRERGDAERMIEQFMLAANEAVARLLSEKELPAVYRIHENPPPERLFDFVTYAHNLGFDTSYISLEKSSPKDLARLLSSAEERGLSAEISYAMLRAMSKAKYSEERSGHFGLALTHYLHFTSPIRRLSDLATHRIIHKVLLEGARPEPYFKYARRAAAAATDAEIRAVGAERRIENLYKVIYMSDKIGEVFDAKINSVTDFGFFAELANTCEGLVPISELDGVFTFDEKNITLRSNKKIYRIGDEIKVRLEEADMLRGKLRFSVV